MFRPPVPAIFLASIFRLIFFVNNEVSVELGRFPQHSKSIMFIEDANDNDDLDD